MNRRELAHTLEFHEHAARHEQVKPLAPDPDVFVGHQNLLLSLPAQTSQYELMTQGICNRSRPMAESRQVLEEEPLISANER